MLRYFRQGLLRSDPEGIEAHIGGCESCRLLLAGWVRSSSLHGDAQEVSTERDVEGAEDGRIEPPPRRRGSFVGRYVVLEQLGAGSMSVVYLGYDPDLQRQLAVKVISLPGGEPASDEVRNRLLREARTLAQLHCPEVVAVYDVGVTADCLFIAMEYVHGQTLRHWLAEKPRPWQEIVDVFLRAGAGLQTAHAHGIVHRDFKPENVLIGEDGHVQVADFGLARIPSALPPLEEDSTVENNGGSLSVTQTGALVGTPAYMSLEQLEGRQVDAASDQFSFCVSLYEALYGTRPFLAPNLRTLREAVKKGLPPRPRGGTAPLWLHRVLERGLQVLPSARYPSISVLLEDLSQRPMRRRRRRALAAAALTAVAVMAFAARQHLIAQRRSCEAAGDAITEAWNPQREAKVEAAFNATGAPFQKSAFVTVSKVLDSYSGAWAQMQRQSCGATHITAEQPAQTAELRTQCLMERLAEERAVVDALAGADLEMVQRAPRIVEGLTDLSACANVALLRGQAPGPTDPAVRVRIGALRTQLARAMAEHLAAHYNTALKIALDAEGPARATGDHALLAHFLYVKGRAQARLHQYRDAEVTLRASGAEGELARRDDLAARAWTLLISLVGTGLERPAEGLSWAEYARAAVARYGEDPPLEATIELAVGNLLPLDQGLPHLRRAVELGEQMGGPPAGWFASALQALASRLGMTGHEDEALRLFQRARTAAEQSGGPRHPDVALVLNNMADLLIRLHRPAEALPLAQESAAIFGAVHGSEDTTVGSALEEVGRALKQLGRLEEAEQACRRSVAIQRAHAPVSSVQRAFSEEALAEVLLEQRKPTEALGLLDEACPLFLPASFAAEGAQCEHQRTRASSEVQHEGRAHRRARAAGH